VGVRLEDHEIAELMRRLSLLEQPSLEAVSRSERKYDVVTLLHPNHLSERGAQHVLDEETRNLIESRYGHWLARYGYS
jgi:hypothetical protein